MYFVAPYWQANMSQGCCKDVGGHIQYMYTVQYMAVIQLPFGHLGQKNMAT